MSSTSLIPAVSIKRIGIPLILAVSSIVSRVVPAKLLTIALSYPKSLFIKLDFPALGGPTIASSKPSLRILPCSDVSIRPLMDNIISSNLRTIDSTVSGVMSSSGKSI